MASVRALAVVPAGGVETELTFAPTAHIWCRSAAGWEDRVATVPRFDEYAR